MMAPEWLMELQEDINYTLKYGNGNGSFNIILNVGTTTLVDPKNYSNYWDSNYKARGNDDT